ncbi:MAG: hypothetical protein JW709_03450 [Sedimentisphaerales bacterium]|nr:hypothetical protein [Sedimentisphaerales bacterium]
MQKLAFIMIMFAGVTAAMAQQWDETGFFRTTTPILDYKENTWTFGNEALEVTLRYDPEAGGLMLDQLYDKQRQRALLAKPSALLLLTNPAGETVLDLSAGWDLAVAPRSLRPRVGAKQASTMGLDIELQSRELLLMALDKISVILRINVFPGDEPYITIEPVVQARWREKTHIDKVYYARLKPDNGGKLVTFAGDAPPPEGVDEENLQTWSPKKATNQHTLTCADGSGGLWVSIGNYNQQIRQDGDIVNIAALANVYLDKYLPLTHGSLGTMMLGVYRGPREAAIFDYQLFLIKHWIAGDLHTIAPHVHDYWYSTRRGISESQTPRLEKHIPIIKECGFHFFWFIYDKHGVWPDWYLEPKELFPGGVNADDPRSIASVFAGTGIGLGLYTAPCRVDHDFNLHYELRHDDCRLYGDLLGRRAQEAQASIWWYEDHPGENYQLDEDLPNQPKGNCSWMWRQGYMLTRQEARRHVPDLAFSRTWVDAVEQLGWAEVTACLDVWGMRGGNQSGGPTREHDLFLADAWRNTVWRIVPVWPLMHHLGHHPVHIRDENRLPSDTEYIDSSAAMYGPFCLNGPLSDTTPIERKIHRKWSDFNWKYREFLRFSLLADFVGDAGKVDGVYHLANANADGVCGFIGLWNKDNDNPIEITLRIRPEEYRLRWKGDITARVWDGDTEIPVRRENGDIFFGPIAMKARSSAVLQINSK